MKKQYIEPKATFITLEVDIIATSEGIMTMSNEDAEGTWAAEARYRNSIWDE